MSNITLEKAVNRLRGREAELVKTQQVVASLLRPGKKEYVDNHNGGIHTQELDENWILVEYKDQICPFPLNQNGACLNPLYISEIDSKVHLSKWSIGPYFNNIESIQRANLIYYTI